MILLDTDVLIDLLRQHPPAVLWLNSLGDEEVGLPGFVVMELLQGCTNKSQQHTVEKTLASFEVVWPHPNTCDDALHTFARFHLSHGIGLLDAVIGQTAQALNLPLVTHNQKHYAAFSDLVTVQPYQK
jgi:predicted nucleic acid-binding protein